jgi:hypothetical protein
MSNELQVDVYPAAEFGVKCSEVDSQTASRIQLQQVLEVTIDILATTGLSLSVSLFDRFVLPFFRL